MEQVAPLVQEMWDYPAFWWGLTKLLLSMTADTPNLQNMMEWARTSKFLEWVGTGQFPSKFETKLFCTTRFDWPQFLRFASITFDSYCFVFYNENSTYWYQNHFCEVKIDCSSPFFRVQIDTNCCWVFGVPTDWSQYPHCSQLAAFWRENMTS